MVAITGSLLLWSHRRATLAAAAEREEVALSARAHDLSDELAALLAEVDRLSHLADVDLADGNMEPEKNVLRLARRDSGVFSVGIAILGADGEVLWAEPRDAHPSGSGAELVEAAKGAVGAQWSGTRPGSSTSPPRSRARGRWWRWWTVAGAATSSAPIRGRDLGSVIGEAERAVGRSVPLAPGMHLEWSGQIDELREAMARLAIVIPVTLLLIALLVYAAVRTWLDTFIVLVSIPVACLGGIVALLLTGEAFSASSAMGFVSIFGIAIQDAILVVTYAQRQWANGRSLEEGARAAAEQQFRPGLMATLTAMFGLLPAALSHAIGAQAQRPLAIVVIGGSLALAGLTRVVQPPMLVVVHGMADRVRARRLGRAGNEAVS